MEKTVNDANIGEVLASDKPVMIDFWATWCGPCRALAPTVGEIAAEYEGRAVIGKCNVDEASDTPVRYNVRNIPTLLFFKDGKLADRLVGAVPKSEIKAKLDALL